MRVLLVLLAGLVGCSDDTKSGVDLRVGDRAGGTEARAGDGPAGRREARAVDAKTAPELKPSDAQPVTCTAGVGTGTISGTVQGQVLSASHALGAKFDLGGLVGYGVGLFTASGTCISAAQALKAAPATLAMLVCSNNPGTYAIGATCPHDATTGIWLQNSAQLTALAGKPKASSGSITIDKLDWTCGGGVKGSFNVSFGSDAVSGTFDTVGCGQFNF